MSFQASAHAVRFMYLTLVSPDIHEIFKWGLKPELTYAIPLPLWYIIINSQLVKRLIISEARA